MEILILTPNGETVKMSTWKTESVIDLKKRISERLFMAPDLQRILFFHGRVLDDENSLGQLAIEDKSVITLVEGLRGSGIRILAKTFDGIYTEIEIDQKETVLNLKKKIEEKLFIDQDLRYMVYKGCVLDNEKKLEDYDIKDGSVINLISRLRGDVYVFVKDLIGKCFSFEVSGKGTVLDLKRKVWEKTSISPDLQKLFFQGIFLEDEKKLEDYGIEDKSVINLVEAESKKTFIRTPDGGTFKQEIGGTRTVRDLKRRIATKLSLTIEELNLVFQYIVLEDDTMVDKLNIVKDSVISVNIITRRIYFEKDEKEIFVQVGMGEKVSDIKRKICERAESSSTDVQLCYKGGRRLEDDKTLLDYKIEDTSKVRVLFLW